MTQTRLPLSESSAAAMARIVELRTEAERHQLVRAARPRRRPVWPATVADALRRSVAAALSDDRAGRGPAPCPTC